MLWSPWETVPECSPQIQAWDYLGGYYIRCRGNFRDSKLKNHLASAGPDYLLATAYVEFIYTLGRQIAQVPGGLLHVLGNISADSAVKSS